MNIKLADSEKVDVLKLLYEQQTELLRHMRQTDITVVSGYLAIQAFSAGFLIQHPMKSHAVILGAIVYSAGLFGTMAFILYQNTDRRVSEIEKLRTVREALGFNEEGIYLSGKAIQAKRKETNSWKWFWGFIIVTLLTLLGIMCILFGGFQA